MVIKILLLDTFILFEADNVDVCLVISGPTLKMLTLWSRAQVLEGMVSPLGMWLQVLLSAVMAVYH